MTTSIERRDLILSGLASAIAATGLGGFPPILFAQSQVSLHQFLAASEKLTGMPNLDPDIAKTLLGGFLATGHGQAMANLVAGQDEYGPLANAVVAAWYSGVYDSGQGQAVAAFNEALVWDALSFTKPFGSCGGEPGYWADPPQD